MEFCCSCLQMDSKYTFLQNTDVADFQRITDVKIDHLYQELKDPVLRTSKINLSYLDSDTNFEWRDLEMNPASDIKEEDFEESDIKMLRDLKHDETDDINTYKKPLTKSKTSKRKTREILTDDAFQDGDHFDCEFIEALPPVKKLKRKTMKSKKLANIKKPIKKGRRRKLEAYVNIIEFTLEQQKAEMQKRKMAMEASKANYKCDLCFKIFREEKTFNNHHRMEHHESIGPFVCDFCKVRRKSKHKLYVHICSHLRAYICKQCGFKSKHGYQATMHKEYHDGKLYICEKCGRTYKRPGAYYSHMRFLHASTFVCDVCGENFLSEAGLALHKKKSLCVPNKDGTDVTGGDVKTRHCVDCDVTFATEEAWRRHRITSDKHNVPNIRTGRSAKRRKKVESSNGKAQ